MHRRRAVIDTLEIARVASISRRLVQSASSRRQSADWMRKGGELTVHPTWHLWLHSLDGEQLGRPDRLAHSGELLRSHDLVRQPRALEGNTLLGDDELEKLVILKMNRDFMSYMRQHYPHIGSKACPRPVATTPRASASAPSTGAGPSAPIV